MVVEWGRSGFTVATPLRPRMNILDMIVIQPYRTLAPEHFILKKELSHLLQKRYVRATDLKLEACHFYETDEPPGSGISSIDYLVL
jgi:hypothetical protein